MSSLIENFPNILKLMFYVIVFLFLLDIILSMIKNILGLKFDFKKALAGAGFAVGAMALKDYYKKNNVSIKDYTIEKVEEDEDNNQE